MLISELRRALQETANQATVNKRTASELEIRLRKELLEARYRLAGRCARKHGAGALRILYLAIL